VGTGVIILDLGLLLQRMMKNALIPVRNAISTGIKSCLEDHNLLRTLRQRIPEGIVNDV
jgi:hypothetical protein